MTAIEKTIKTFQKGTLFTIDDFNTVCPFTIEELRKPDRSRNIMLWRQIGMVWYAINLNHLANAGNVFNKDHATVIHSLKMVQLANNGYHPELKEKLDKVLDAKNNHLIVTNDINTNQITALRNLERLMNKKLKKYGQIV